MPVRDHTPITIDKFNGLYARGRTLGDYDSVPLDHFSDCNNIQFSENGFAWRDGIDTIPGPGDVIRMYRYKSPTLGEGLIVLDVNGDFYHQSYSPDITNGPILSIAGATDFAFVEIAGRAFISPITGLHGTSGEFLYIYDGTGGASVARKAAGDPPTNSGDKPLVAYNSPVDGLVDMGLHVIGITYDNGGALSAALGPEVLAVVYAPGNKEINVQNIPVSGVLNRRLYMTRAIDPKDYDPAALPTFYEALQIANATDTTAIISISDAQLTVAFAAGATATPTDGGALRAANSTTEGFASTGLHIFGVVYETDSGYLTAPGPEFFAVQTVALESKKITITGVPTGGATVTKRHIVATRAIVQYDGNQSGYQLYFVPAGEIADNVTTTITFSFFDEELIDDASYLIDNFAEIPAGAVLNTYNGRLVLANTAMDEGVAYLSAPGEPEAIDQVDGFLQPPLRTEEITNAQEFRDTLYIFKTNRTYAYVDNGDVPSLWDEPTTIDNGIGTGFHGIATVLDSGGVNIEFIIICHDSGCYLFTGTYIKKELSWKINTYWRDISGGSNGTQIFTDSINKLIYMCLANGRMLLVDFKVDLSFEEVKWTPWSFDAFISTIAMFDGPRLLLGSSGNA